MGKFKELFESANRVDEGIPLAGHPYHSKTNDELRYIQKDAGEAAVAMKGHDPKAEAKYLDQVNDASTVLHHRSKKESTDQVDEAKINGKDPSEYKILSSTGPGSGGKTRVYLQHSLTNKQTSKHAKEFDTDEEVEAHKKHLESLGAKRVR